MIPFLKPKKQGSVIQAKYSEGGMVNEGEEGMHSMGVMSAAEDLISAVHAKDATGVADALKAHHDMKMSEDDDAKEDFLSADED